MNLDDIKSQNTNLFEKIKKFSEIEKTPTKIQEYFDEISYILLNETLLKIKSKWYRISEIEFYYNDNEKHPDPFTHNDPIQYNKNYWYFHRKGGTYRGGTWKGVDITFGQLSPVKFSGGILIRSIREILNGQAGEYIHGPSKVVDTILKIFNQTSVKELIEKKFDNIIDITKNKYFSLYSINKNLTTSENVEKYNKDSKKRQLSIEKEEEELSSKKKKKLTKTNSEVIQNQSDKTFLWKETVYQTPRVGLTPHHENGEKELNKEYYYLMRNYRYLIYPNIITKGKVQFILSLYWNNNKLNRIEKITETKKPVIEKYISDFEKGKKMKLKQLNIKKVEDLCRLFGLIYNHLH